MKDELIVTLIITNNVRDTLDFVTIINKTNNLSALLLPKLDENNNYHINIYKIS